VSPPKPYDQVQAEAAEAHDMYVYSHKDFDPGQQVNREYKTGHYRKDNQFGKPTPHDNAGELFKLRSLLTAITMELKCFI